jgi:hypothetical protein
MMVGMIAYLMSLFAHTGKQFGITLGILGNYKESGFHTIS